MAQTCQLRAMRPSTVKAVTGSGAWVSPISEATSRPGTPRMPSVGAVWPRACNRPRAHQPTGTGLVVDDDVCAAAVARGAAAAAAIRCRSRRRRHWARSTEHGGPPATDTHPSRAGRADRHADATASVPSRRPSRASACRRDSMSAATLPPRSGQPRRKLQPADRTHQVAVEPLWIVRFAPERPRKGMMVTP